MFTVNSGWETFLSITDVLDHKVLENPMTCMIKKSVNSESLRYREPSARQRAGGGDAASRQSADAAPAAESGWRCESRGAPVRVQRFRRHRLAAQNRAANERAGSRRAETDVGVLPLHEFQRGHGLPRPRPFLPLFPSLRGIQGFGIVHVLIV